MNIKKLTLGLLAVAFSFLLIFTVTTNRVNAGTSDLTGWAWSPNIGWISLNCANTNSCGTSNYKVQIATTTAQDGTFNGYAWSSNIGWVKFAGDKDHEGPTIDFDKGGVTGWIRACAGTVNKDCASADRTDGWDGSMKHSEPGTIYPTRKTDGTGGLTYDLVDGLFKGYAWGGSLGWLSFITSVSPASNVKCPGCIGGVNVQTITAGCVFAPSLFNVKSGDTTVISPSVGSYAGGVATYTYSPNSFTVGEGVNQVMSVTVTDSSSPTAKTSVVSCTPVTVQVGPVGTPSIKMWLPPASGTDTKANSTIIIKPGENATVKWEFASGSDFTACKWYVDGTRLAGADAVSCGDGATVIRTGLLLQGNHTYSMSAVDSTSGSPTNGQDINGTAPNGHFELQINVTNSKVIEK